VEQQQKALTEQIVCRCLVFKNSIKVLNVHGFLSTIELLLFDGLEEL
jgi:hypothetical protein